LNELHLLLIGELLSLSLKLNLCLLLGLRHLSLGLGWVIDS